MKFKAIIFDMDGTLINSESIWAKYETNFIQQYVPSFTKKDNQEIIGQSIYGTYALVCKKFPKEMQNVSREEFLKAYEQFGFENIYPNVDLLPGAQEFLNTNQSMPMALASSAQKSWMDMVINKHQLKPFFKVIICGQDVKNAKPDPEIFITASQRLGAKPEECLVFEDSKNGVTAAKKAGMTVYAIRTEVNGEQDLSKADKIFTNYSDIDLE